MKKLLIIILGIFMVISLDACSGNQINSNKQNSAESSAVGKTTATAGNLPKSSKMSTRTIKNGTAITLTVGNKVIPATLNNSTSSKELLSRLPYTVHLNRFDHDYCGVMKNPLKYDEKDVHNGWLDGDIDFATDGKYFTVLFENQENSKKYGYQVNMGKVDGDLSVIKGLGSSIDVKVDLKR